MTENMKKFLETVSKSEELTAKINGMDKEAIIAAAKALGIELTDTDFAQPGRELDDDELDTVAGGADCYCAVGGGGTATRKDEATCACVAAGFGDYYGRDDNNNRNSSQTTRCYCALGGFGAEW